MFSFPLSWFSRSLIAVLTLDVQLTLHKTQQNSTLLKSLALVCAFGARYFTLSLVFSLVFVMNRSSFTLSSLVTRSTPQSLDWYCAQGGAPGGVP